MTDDEIDRCLADLNGSDAQACAEPFTSRVVARVAAVGRRRTTVLCGASLVGGVVATLGLGWTPAATSRGGDAADVVSLLVLAGACAAVWVAGVGWPALPASLVASPGEARGER